MQKLLIKGKKELKGNIYISGSKNATLPILASTILASEVRLLNVPFVKDIFTMLELLKFIGIKVKIKRNKNILELKNNILDEEYYTSADLFDSVVVKPSEGRTISLTLSYRN